MHFFSKTNSRRTTNRLILGLLLLGISGFIFQSCTKDYFDFDKMKDPEWNPEYALPIANSRVDVYDFLDRFDDEDIIVINADGLLALKYYTEVFSLKASDLINIPDASFPAGYILSPADATNFNTNGSLVVSNSPTMGFPTNGEMLTSILYKSGDIVFSYQNNMGASANVTVSIPSLTDGNGNNFSWTASNVPANSGQLVSPPQDISGYTLDLSQGGGGFNQVQLMVSLTLVSGGPVAGGETFSLDASLSNQQFSNLYGDLGQLNVTTGFDSVRLRVFENSVQGTIEYENPKLIAIFENSFGAPLGIDFDVLKAKAPSLLTTITTTGGGFGEGTNVVIAAPGTIGNSAVTIFADSAANSNMPTAINSSPTHILYDITATTNPSGGAATNFVTDTSVLKLDVDAELPFWGKAINFVKVDTFGFDLPADSTIDSNDVQEVQSIMIRVLVDNGFPAEASAQVYFADSAYNVIDSLFGPNEDTRFFDSGELTGDRVLIPSGIVRSWQDIWIRRDKLEKLRDNRVNTLLLFSKVETSKTGSTVVKVYKDSYMDVRVGIRIELLVKSLP